MRLPTGLLGETEKRTGRTQETWDDNHGLSDEDVAFFASGNRSRENKRNRFWTAMEEALIGWDVTVVLTYRRYFEWLPSSQREVHIRLTTKEPWP